MFVTSTVRRSTLLPLCTPHFYFVADSWSRVFVLFFYSSVTIPTVAIVFLEAVVQWGIIMSKAMSQSHELLRL